MSDNKPNGKTMTWPERILSLRIKLGMTQKEFADRMGTWSNSVNRWERGKSNPAGMARKKIEEMEKEYGKQNY